MTTALTLYLGSGVPTDLSPAQNAIDSPSSVSGSITTGEYSKNATGWGFILSGGTVGINLSATEIPTASGTGFLWDVTTLEGNTIASGDWTAALTLSAGFSSATGEAVVRAYVFNGGIYTQIGSDMIASGISIGTTPTTTVFPASTFTSQDFGVGDKLYVDVQFHFETGFNTNTATNRRVKMLVNYQSGAMIVTPGYDPTGGGGGGGDDAAHPEYAHRSFNHPHVGLGSVFGMIR